MTNDMSALSQGRLLTLARYYLYVETGIHEAPSDFRRGEGFRKAYNNVAVHHHYFGKWELTGRINPTHAAAQMPQRTLERVGSHLSNDGSPPPSRTDTPQD